MIDFNSSVYQHSPGIEWGTFDGLGLHLGTHSLSAAAAHSSMSHTDVQFFCSQNETWQA